MRQALCGLDIGQDMSAQSASNEPSPLAIVYAVGVLLGVVSLIEVVNVVSVLPREAEYEPLWGSESRWIYASQTRYVAYNTQAALTGLLPVVLLLHPAPRRRLLCLRGALVYSLALAISQLPACLS
jgi:hypothetical protein